MPRPRPRSRRLAAAILTVGLLGAGATPAAADDDWARVPTPNAIEGQHNFVHGLDCTAPDDCWAVGFHYSPTGNKTLTMHWDGATWSLVPSPTPEGHTLSNLWGVDCAAPDRCWAVGFSFDGQLDYAALMLGWDGEAWSLETLEDSPTPGSDFLYDVACPSASDCWAVGRHLPGTGGAGGFGRTLINRWNGASWSIVDSPNTLPTQSNSVVSVDCASPRDCWAVGSYAAPTANQTLTLHWDGEGWAVVPSPNSSPEQANALNGVTCVSPHDCWAVGIYSGQQNQALAMRWDGASWSLVPIPSSAPNLANVLTGVACVSPVECWAVGYQRESTWLVTLIERWDGEEWRIVPSPNSAYGETNNLWPVDCVGSECWAAGYYYGTGSIARTMALHHRGGPPAAGPEARAPHIVDPPGDANLVNSQGLGQELDVRTDPASVGGADVVGVWFETTYDTVVERDAEGAVRFVRHVPTGLRMRVKTTEPADPTFGPTLTYRVPVAIDASCQAWLSFYVPGDAPGSLDREGATIVRQTGCQDTTEPAGATLSLDGNLAVATFPLDTSGGVLAQGMELGPWSRPSVRVAAGNGTQQLFTAPAIDEAPPMSSFVIGSDLPPDVDCLETPGHPACAA